jgi:hypothetical protein
MSKVVYRIQTSYHKDDSSTPAQSTALPLATCNPKEGTAVNQQREIYSTRKEGSTPSKSEEEASETV